MVHEFTLLERQEFFDQLLRDWLFVEELIIVIFNLSYNLE